MKRIPDDIRGEVTLITGASRGLGLLLARELARHSAPWSSAPATKRSWNARPGNCARLAPRSPPWPAT